MEWDREDFFRLIQTLPTFWVTWIRILRLFIFDMFGITNFWISRFQDFQNLAQAGLGWALARLGLGGPSGRTWNGAACSIAPSWSNNSGKVQKSTNQFKDFQSSSPSCYRIFVLFCLCFCGVGQRSCSPSNIQG